MKKKHVVVIFGGRSSEHEVSLMSAVTIINNIDKNYYDITLIGITKEGRWLKAENKEDIISGIWTNSRTTAVLLPDAELKSVLLIEHGKVSEVIPDVVIPVLHGLNGEDGTIQGLLELSGIPYAGCGVLASAVSMDKLYTKLIVDTLGIAQADYIGVLKKDLNDMDKVTAEIEKKLTYPVYVKPSNAGSSRGVSKACDRQELIEGLHNAAKHDRKILVERAVAGRELECAVLGGIHPKASGIGEILPAAEFYDYDAKYNSSESQTVLSPELPEGKAEEIREYALKIFEAVDGYGLARVDFFLEKDTNRVIFNEINTMPGFTSISMYPELWKEKGISGGQLVEKLIQLALSRREQYGL